MSFGFRKSFTSGPFRMTLSKTGVSMSVGAGGARLTTGPRGTHVSFSKGGFYYRTRLDTPPARRATPQAPKDPSGAMETGHLAAEIFPENAPTIPTPEIFGDTTPDAVVQAINSRIKRRNYAFPIAVVISVGLFALSAPWTLAAGIGAFSGVLIGLLFHRSKYSTLTYGNEDEAIKRMEILQKAVAALLSAESVWSVREASLNIGLTPQPPTLSRTKIATDSPRLPKYVRTNIAPAALQLTDCALYFMPDRLFIWHSGHFVAVDYGNLKLSFSRVTFLEREGQPKDATVQSQMRRSLANEPRIPVFYYGSIEIDAAPSFKARLMTSRPESAQEFVTQMRTLTGNGERTPPEVNSKESLYTHFDTLSVPLFYDMSDEGIQQIQRARDAFAIIAKCDCVWRSETEERTDDWKRHAEAATLVTRTRIYPKIVDTAPEFESNVALGLSVGDTTLFLLPDGAVTYVGNRFQAEGETLSVDASTFNFREEDVAPRDGEVT